MIACAIKGQDIKEGGWKYKHLEKEQMSVKFT